ncbi:unnamed protein product [Notodromas monacha]|uniref:Uncharacterized protein n=1 Tax=Notodromas monacha TaxID=399045 RepID=A0A7R9G9X2_9CRUS|nr:unnamed protein product [Notodromas monacha]CAG0913076.1 unnamed protein product [Notodromas monacha]
MAFIRGSTSVFLLLWITLLFIALNNKKLVLRHIAKFLNPLKFHDTCSSLLTSGNLSKNLTWSPSDDGCEFLVYSKENFLECLENREERGFSNVFVFTGDSRIRYLSQCFMRNSGYNLSEAMEKMRKGVHVTYPHLYKSNSFVSYYGDVFMHEPAVMPTNITLSQTTPALIVAGSAAWYIAEDMFNSDLLFWNMSQQQRVKIYRGKVRKWAVNATAFLEQHPESKVLWMIQEPVDETAPHYYFINNRKIDLYNRAAIAVLKDYPRIQVWYSGRDYSIKYQELGHSSYSYPDPIHMSHAVMTAESQILLNLLCNDFVTDSDAEDRCLCCSHKCFL